VLSCIMATCKVHAFRALASLPQAGLEIRHHDDFRFYLGPVYDPSPPNSDMPCGRTGSLSLSRDSGERDDFFSIPSDRVVSSAPGHGLTRVMVSRRIAWPGRRRDKPVKSDGCGFPVRGTHPSHAMPHEQRGLP